MLRYLIRAFQVARSVLTPDGCGFRRYGSNRVILKVACDAAARI